MQTFLKASRVFVLGLVVGLYTAFVLQSFWNWFVVGALNVRPVSYWAMYGLNMLGMLILESSHNDALDKERWERAFMMLYACLPSERKQEVDDHMAGDNEMMWFNAGLTIVTQAFGLTVALGVGWIVHTFLLEGAL